MPAEKVIITSSVPDGVRLPGTIALPTGKQPIRMGSGIITSLISSGGMAIIYEIWNSELEVKRAIKLLHPDHSKESEERFYTEMKITAKLHHPNIVEIYGVGRWNGLPFIEMERIDGVTLHELLSECGRLPIEVCTAIGLIVGRALNYSHNQDYVLYGRKYHGIIHRDLKPANIMITRDGTVKLMDFGIARPMTASIHTCEGTVLGTMQYLAPEQLDGSITDARADIYSLACVLYEMLTGGRAFPELNIAKLVPEKLNNTFVPLDQFSLKIPSALVNLIHKCMRHDKERRVQNMLEFLKLLGHIHSALTAEPPEKIMQRFMRDKRQYRNAARARKKIRALAVLGWLSAALAAMLGLAAGAHFLFWGADAPLSRLAARSSALPPQAAQPATASDLREDTAPQTTRELQSAPVAEATVSTIEPGSAKNEPQGGFSPSPPVRARKPLPASAAANIPLSKPSRVDVAISAPTPRANPVSSDPQPAQPTLAERLAAQYRTNDLLAILAAEADKANYRNVLDLYHALSSAERQHPRAILCRLRAARGLPDWKIVNGILDSVDLRDGEFYLEKAMSAYRAKNYANAQALLDQAATLPAAYIDHAVLYQSILYGKALCASGELDKASIAANKQRAMTAWYELKSLLRSNPDHRYYRIADEEIRRINKIEAHP